MRDALNFVATAQALTSDAVSENSIDLASANKQIGLSGRPLFLHILVTTGAGGMASGARFEMVDDSVEALAGSPRVIVATNLLAASDLAAGAHIVMPIPPGKLQRYFGFNWNVVSEAASALVVDSWVDDCGPDDLTIVS